MLARFASPGLSSVSMTFDPEPTEMYNERSSSENARSRVQWPPVDSRGTTTSAGPRARKSPL